jgi:hypothetical protein
MNAPLLQIIWLNRRLIVGVMCLTFLALTIGIFMLPKPGVMVRSAIEIGSDGKLDPLELTDHVAKQLSSVYAPAVLLRMAKNGALLSVLSALKEVNVESAGRLVVLNSMVDPSAENAAREFQEAIDEQIIKRHAPRTLAIREDISSRIVLVTQASGDLEQQIRADNIEIDRITALSDDLRSQIENQRANLATLNQHAGTEQRAAETDQTQTRELQGQIAGLTTLMSNLMLEHSHLTRDLAEAHRRHEAKTSELADAQFRLKMLSETHISLPPSLMPALSTSRRPALLIIALVVSVLAAFGVIVLLYNTRERNI